MAEWQRERSESIYRFSWGEAGSDPRRQAAPLADVHRELDGAPRNPLVSADGFGQLRVRARGIDSMTAAMDGMKRRAGGSPPGASIAVPRCAPFPELRTGAGSS